jgi:hypothetical protein
VKKPISNLQYKRFKEGDRFKRFGETWFTFAPNGEPNCLFFAAQIHNDHFCKPWVCPRLQSKMMTYVKSPGAGANNVLAARAQKHRHSTAGSTMQQTSTCHPSMQQPPFAAAIHCHYLGSADAKQTKTRSRRRSAG